jgi:hypothetical protein
MGNRFGLKLQMTGEGIDAGVLEGHVPLFAAQ